MTEYMYKWTCIIHRDENTRTYNVANGLPLSKIDSRSTGIPNTLLAMLNPALYVR